MIQTIPSEELVLNGLKRGDLLVWDHAFLQKNKTWFYVDWCEKGAQAYSEVIMLGTPDNLRDFAEHYSQDIRAVYVVTPPHINYSNEWKFQPLSAIYEIPSSLENCQIFIYELKDGNRYADLRMEDLRSIDEDKIFIKLTIGND